MSAEGERLFRRASRALERVLGLDPEARESALEGLAREDPELERAVRRLSGAAPAEGAPDDGLEIGDWRLLGLLGRGGMGDVFLAARSGAGFEQLAALKLLRRGLDTEQVIGRFLRERQILARLDHPGIARLLDGGVAPDGRPYFVMERVEGVPITEFAERAALDPTERVRLVREICTAVEAAHRRLVVHRDLKPSNVLVDAGGRPKLLDFGVAKLLDLGAEDPAATRLGSAPLTPAYAAPEQILGGAVTTATDVYALGVLLHELLTGERPHERAGSSPTELVSELMRERLVAPSARVRRRARATEPGRARRALELRADELEGDLDAILTRALGHEAEGRYPTVAAFSADLGRFLVGQPVKARGAVRGYRLRKLVGRHRVAFGAALLAALSLVGGLGLAVWQARRALAEARRAEAVSGFLVELFEGAEAGAITARDLLDGGARRLERSLERDPPTRTSLADALARSYLGLGAYAEAGRWAALAERSALGLYGSGDRRVDLARLRRLEVTLTAGDVRPARAELGALVPRIEAGFGAASPEALQAVAVLGLACEQSGEKELALAQARRGFEIARRLYGEDALETADQQGAVASTLAALGRYPESIADFRAALGRVERAGRERSPEWIRLAITLADVLDTTAASEEALALYARAIPAARALLGPDHPTLGEALVKQGIALVNARRNSEAEAALAEAVRIFRAVGHYDLGSALRYLGFAALARERFGEARDRFAEAESVYREKVGPDSPMTWAAVTARAFAEIKLGRLDLAEAPLRAAIEAISRQSGAESNEVRAPIKYLGELMRRAGRPAAALELHQRALAIERKLFATDEHPAVALSRNQLALDRLALATPAALAEAQRDADAAVAFCRARPAEEARLGEFLATSGRVALARGDRERARSELAAAVEKLVARLGPEAPSAIAARAELARVGGR